MNLRIHFKKLFTGVCITALALSATGCRYLTYNVSKTQVQTAVVSIAPTTMYRPIGTITDSSETIAPPEGVELPTLSASNLSISAGSPIDYLGNLVIEGEGDTEITEIYVDTSKVRPNVPGIYNATYTINFRGYPVSKTIVITITPPEEGSEAPTYASTIPGTPIADMVVTLLSGKQCAVPCTTEHYILETYTEETTETILDKKYLKSVLIVKFNDGEIIELETVRNRIADTN